ncbi:MAG TPA: serine/threonine-protein kinase, partial [Streptosporangiaceae bacterium]
GRPVAVKAIRAELAANPEFRARFGREVAAARRVSGVFTAQVVDADVDGPVAWMATAYVPGPSLAEAVDTHGPLPDASLLALAAGLAESLNAIHAVGVVHRDLKPSNVLLAEDGPRVIDFGISRATESTMLTQAGLVVGSPGFMSPEQAMGSDVGPPSDIFNLGAVLAFAATGEGPFGTGTTAALLYRVVHGAPSLDLVPPTVRPLIEHCLAKNPRQRPTANGLLAEVGALQPDGTWLPESLTRTFAQGTPSRPSFAWSGPVAAAAAGAAAGAAVAGSNPALAGTDSAYAPPAGPSGPSGPRTPAPGSWPYTGAGALTATAGSAPPTPPMGAYPPATSPPMPPDRGRPPRRRRMKPLAVALILGGIVGAGGAAAFALTSFTGQPAAQLEQPAGQTSSPPASVGPAVNSATTAPSASQSTSSSPAPPPSQPTSTYSSPATRATTTSPTTSPTTSSSTSASTSSSAPASTSSSAPATPPSTPPSSSAASTTASTSASSPASAPSSAPSS